MKITFKLPPTIYRGLKEFMLEDEETRDVVSSTWTPTRGTDYLIFTNKRIIHVWYRLWAVDFDDFEYDESVFDLDYGPLYDLINIKIRGQVVFSMTVFTTERKRIIHILHLIERMSEEKKGGGGEGFREKLEDLAQLYKEGILTKEEYDQKKKEILGNI